MNCLTITRHVALTNVLIIAAACLMGAPAGAVDYEWDGDAFEDDWDAYELNVGDDNTNWVGLIIDDSPGSNDTVLFGGVAASDDLTVDLNGNRRVIEVTFDRADSYLLDTTVGTNRLRLGNGDITVLDGSHTINSNVQLLDNGAWNISEFDGLTVEGAISEFNGTFRLTKQGLGTLKLRGANTYLGQTRVNGGTLTVSGADERIADTSAIKVAAGATFEVDGMTETVAGLRNFAGSVVLSNNAVLKIGADNVLRSFPGVISGTGSLVKVGTGVHELNGANTYSGGTTIESGVLRIPDDAALGDTSGAVTLDGGTLRVTDVTSGTRNFVINATGGTIDVDELADAYTLDGVISDGIGAGALNKAGSGTLRLSSANTFSGATNIDAGQIVLDNANALQNSTVSIKVDGGLDINAIDATIGALAGSGNLALGSQELITGGNGDTTVYAGVIDGGTDSRLRHDGAGTLSLTGGDDTTPSRFGTLRAESGTVEVDGARINLRSTALSSSTAALLATGGDITIQNGADVQMRAASLGLVENATLTVTDSGTSLSGGTMRAGDNVGDTDRVVVEVGASLDLSFAAIIGAVGNGDLTVRSGATASADLVRLGVTATGSGDALVTGNDSLFSANSLNLGGQDSIVRGGTATLMVEDGGAVQVSDETMFWTSASSITVDGGTFETDRLNNHTGVVATVSISDPTGGTALTVGTHDGDSTFDGLIEDVAGGGDGSLKKTSAGTFTLTNTNTYSGGTHIDGGVLAVGADANLGNSAGSLSFDGGTLRYDAEFDLENTRAISLKAGGGIFDTNGADTTIGQAITGAGVLTKTGDGTLTLESDNSHGGTRVEGGVLAIGDFRPLGSSGKDLTLANGATLQALGGWTAPANRQITLESDGTIDTNGRNMGWDGMVTGAGALTKTGDGRLKLTDVTNDYMGGTALNGGILAVAADGTLGDPAGPLLFDGGTLRFDASFDLASTRSITLNAGGGTFDTNGFDTKVDDSVDGAGGLTKIGAGTLILSTANSYGGGTTLSGGTLSLFSSGALGSGDLVVLGSTIDYADGVEIGNTIELQNDVTLNVDTGGATQSGLISETGGPFGITKTGSGSLTLSEANTFTGTTSIEAGQIVLEIGGALKNSIVSIDVDGGLDVTTNNVDATIAGLTGSGDLVIGKTVTVDGNADTVYTGSISEFQVGTRFVHEKGGSLTLSGIDSDNTLSNVRIQRGGNIVVEDGASLDVRNTLLVGLVGAGELTIQSGGTAAIGSGIIGTESGTTGTILVTHTDSSWSATALNLGGDSGNLLGGTGTLTIDDNAMARVSGRTKFWSSASSITVNRGAFFTDRLTDHAGVTATISIFDIDPNTPALTVGTHDRSSTFDGLIQDAVGEGSLMKTGTGTFTLTGANTYTGGTIIDGGSLLANNSTGSATGPVG